MLPSPLLLPARTVTGPGVLSQLAAEARAFGASGLLVHGHSLAASGRLRALTEAWPPSLSLDAWEHTGGEPTLAQVDALRDRLRQQPVDWVAAVGGGSVIDLAKAAAGLVGAALPAAAYQTGAPIPPAHLPLIAVPTTAGTGSETTVVAVLTDDTRQLKQSIRHPSFMPRVVLLDPDLLRTCPRPTLAAAGMDAIVQAFESWTSRHATPFSRALSELALLRLLDALPAVCGGDWSRAGDLLSSSYLAGLALSHARLGVVHGLAHPLGARWHAAHGLVCAVCLPAALAFNRPAIAADLDALEAKLGEPFETRVQNLLGALKLKSPFRGQPLPLRDREAIVDEILASGSTAANPRPVTREDAAALLARIFANGNE